jgi:hypothetical protein
MLSWYTPSLESYVSSLQGASGHSEDKHYCEDRICQEHRLDSTLPKSKGTCVRLRLQHIASTRQAKEAAS